MAQTTVHRPDLTRRLHEQARLRVIMLGRPWCSGVPSASSDRLRGEAAVAPDADATGLPSRRGHTERMCSTAMDRARAPPPIAPNRREPVHRS